jgi:hypothetical protein
MYNPPHFEETRTAVVHQAMREIGLVGFTFCKPVSPDSSIYAMYRMATTQHPSPMAPKSSSEKTKSQASDGFMSVAKCLECDEDKARFEAKLGKLAKATSKKAKLK